jgi:multidrug resistance protein
MQGNTRILFIFLTVFIDMLGASVLIPVTPYIVAQFRDDALSVALLSVVFSALQFFTGPMLGTLSDRIGRRPVILTCLLGTALSHFVFGIGGALWVLFLARILDGLTGANISTAQAYIADVSRPEDRSRNFGMIGAAFGLGFLIGPAIGGALGQISLQAPAFLAGTLALANTLIGFLILPESLPKERRDTQALTWARLNPVAALGRASRMPAIAALLFAVFATNFAFSGLQTNWIVLTLKRFGWGPLDNALAFFVIGVMSVIMQAGVLRKLIPRFGDRKLALLGLAGQTLVFAVIAVIVAGGASWMMYAVSIVLPMFAALSGSTLTGMISSAVSEHEQGAILGLTESVNALTRVFGPFWAGFVFDAVGPGAPYYTGALWILVAFVILLGFRIPDQSKSHQLQMR